MPKKGTNANLVGQIEELPPHTGHSPTLEINEGFVDVMVKGIPFIGFRCFAVPEGRCLFFFWLAVGVTCFLVEILQFFPAGAKLEHLKKYIGELTIPVDWAPVRGWQKIRRGDPHW